MCLQPSHDRKSTHAQYARILYWQFRQSLNTLTLSRPIKYHLAFHQPARQVTPTILWYNNIQFDIIHFIVRSDHCCYTHCNIITLILRIVNIHLCMLYYCLYKSIGGRSIADHTRSHDGWLWQGNAWIAWIQLQKYIAVYRVN